MASGRVMPGCCVSKYVTITPNDTLASAASQFCNGTSVAWVAVNPETMKHFFDAFVEAEIPFEKLGNGQVFFFGSSSSFQDACNSEALRPIIEWEKKEGRKRNEKRVGDIVDVSNWIGRGFEGRVYQVKANGSVFVELTKIPKNYEYSYRVGQRFDNYSTGFAPSYFPIILPKDAAHSKGVF